MKIGIGNDHAAVDMKNQVVEYLEGKGYEVVAYIRFVPSVLTAT